MKNYSKIFFLFLILVNKLAFSQINFQPAQVISTNDRTTVVAIGDINNDGLNDVVLAAQSIQENLYVFLQNNIGELDSAVLYPFPSASSVTSIVIDDINGDSLNDVVIAYDNYFGVFFQNSSGTLDPIQPVYNNGYNIISLKTGDFNNDGLQDIVTLNSGTNWIHVYYKTSTGYNFLSYLVPFNGFYSEIDVGDMNGDGQDDIVLTRHVSIIVLTQQSTGGFNSAITYPPFLTGNQSYISALALGDLNNDSRYDAISLKSYNTPKARVVCWFQDTIQGTLQTPATELIAYDVPDAVEIADLNNDGKNEIIVAHGSWSKVTIYEQNSAGVYNNYLSFSIPHVSGYTVQGLSVGDINNDGKKDIAIAAFELGMVLLINSSTPTSIEYSDIGQKFEVFPNPVSEALNISLKTSNGVNAVSYVYDIFGREMQSKELIFPHTSLDFSTYSSGIYHVKIVAGDHQIYYKIIKTTLK